MTAVLGASLAHALDHVETRDLGHRDVAHDDVRAVIVEASPEPTTDPTVRTLAPASDKIVLASSARILVVVEDQHTHTVELGSHEHTHRRRCACAGYRSARRPTWVIAACGVRRASYTRARTSALGAPAGVLDVLRRGVARLHAEQIAVALGHRAREREQHAARGLGIERGAVGGLERDAQARGDVDEA